MNRMNKNGRAMHAVRLLALSTYGTAAAAATFVTGQVRDINGNPLPQVMVTLSQPPRVDGAGATTVFSDADGRFRFVRPIADRQRGAATVEAKALGYAMVSPQQGASRLPAPTRGSDVVDMVLVLQPRRNQADTAPASAWLKAIPDTEPRKALVVRECVACHQVAHPDMRQFMGALDDTPGSRTAEGRKQSWQQLLTYMYGTSHEFFGAALHMPYNYRLHAGEIKHLGPLAETLTKYLPERLDFVEYAYGAPLAVTARTQIREYPIANLPGQKFNVLGTREAVLAGKPLSLWAVDVASDHVFKINPETGRYKTLSIPFPGMTGPHTIYTGHDGQIWLAYLFQQLHGKIDPQSDKLTVAQYKTAANDYYVAHDYSTDWHNKVQFDTQGRLWFGDVASNSLGSIDQRTGETKLYRGTEKNLVDASEGAGANTGVHLDDLYVYGTVMTSDRKHVWYSQLNGRFGEFNTETLKYETIVDVPPSAAPRRMAITEKDILYVPLFGTGQIVQYDARARRQLAVFDLPDRASAPYAVTWDAVRQVLWIATSNADLIYRFDPQDRSFGVIPLPRQRTFLRMLQVEPESGMLATSYGLLPARAPGPRMALIIDPGDGYPRRGGAGLAPAGKAALQAPPRPVPATATPAPVQPARKVTVAKIEQMSKANQCVSCHSVKEARIGPPFAAVAARYAQQPRAAAVEVLTAKILHGGAGNWGVFPMPARARFISADDARTIARAILALDTGK